MSPQNQSADVLTPDVPQNVVFGDGFKRVIELKEGPWGGPKSQRTGVILRRDWDTHTEG